MKPNKNYHGGTRVITSVEEENLERYFNEIRKYEPLPKEEERELIIRYREGDKTALEKLIKHNLKFVVRVAKTYQGQGVLLMDLIQEGSAGMIEAAKRFDINRNLKFSSYAVWWIKICIITSFDLHKRLIQIPANRIGLVTKVRRKLNAIESETGRHCSVEDLKEHFKDYSEDDLEEALTLSIIPVSLFKDISFKKGEEEQQLIETLEVKDQIKTDDSLTKESFKEDLTSLLFNLPQRTYDVFVLMFGLNGEDKWTNDNIRQVFVLNTNKIMNIKKTGLKLLRKQAERTELNTYL
jgi:RNA polymerase primary sigma factor